MFVPVDRVVAIRPTLLVSKVCIRIWIRPLLTAPIPTLFALGRPSFRMALWKLLMAAVSIRMGIENLELFAKLTSRPRFWTRTVRRYIVTTFVEIRHYCPCPLMKLQSSLLAHSWRVRSSLFVTMFFRGLVFVGGGLGIGVGCLGAWV